MRKIFLFCSLFTIHYSLVFAQHDSCKAQQNAYINISGGVGLSPRALFLPTSTIQWMDYVKPGYNVTVSGSIPVCHSRFGITELLGYYSNGFDMTKYLNAITPVNSSGTYAQDGYGSFTQYTFMLGGYASLCLGKTTILLRLMGGVEYLSLPNYAFTVTYPQPIGLYETNNYTYFGALAPAFDGGIQVAYHVCKKVAITYSSDVLLADPSYNNASAITARGGTNTSVALSYAPVFMLNALLGVSYVFGK